MLDPLLAADRAERQLSLGDLDESAHDKRPLWQRWVKEDLYSPLLGTTVLLPFAVAFVGMIVSAMPCISHRTPTLLSTVILTQGLGTLFFSRFSQYTTCTNVDLLTSAFLANVGVKIQEQARFRHGSHLCGDALFVVMIIVQGLFSILVGALLVFIAKVDGIWYLRFLPYPVACGFLTGIGMLIIDGGFELGCGHSMKEMAVGWSDLDTSVYTRAVTALGVAGVFTLLKRFIGSALRLPFGLLIVSVAVHGGAYLLGFSEAQLQENGMFLSGLQPEPWYTSYQLSFDGIWSFDIWDVVNEPCFTMTLSYAVLHILANPFYAAGLEEIDKPESKLDLQKEIKRLGQLNILTGCLGGVASCHSYKVCIVMQAAGAKTRLWVVMLGCTFGMLYFDPSVRPLIGLVPKCAFGGLVVSLGWDFLSGSLIESKQRVGETEQRAVIITGVVIYFNVLVGLVFGCMLTMILFIVEYAGITGLTNQATCTEIRSLLKRPQSDVEVLEKFGDEVAIFWSSGYIFFGTATNIVEEVEEYLDNHLKTRIVIIDFEAVPAVDASGVHALTEFMGRAERRRPRVQVCFCGLVRRLHMAVKNVVGRKDIKHQPRLSSARLEESLEWAEEKVLEARRHAVSPPMLGRHRSSLSAGANYEDSPIKGFIFDLLAEMAPSAPQGAIEDLVEVLAGVATLKTWEDGSKVKGQLYKEGQPASELFYVVSGRAKLKRLMKAETAAYKLPRHHLNEVKGDHFSFEESCEVLVEIAEKGSVLGAVEFGASILGEKLSQPRRQTGAVAAPKVTALVIPFKALHEALAKNPFAGHPVMAWLSARASSQVLELMRSSNMRAYRSAATDEAIFSQAVAPADEDVALEPTPP